MNMSANSSVTFDVSHVIPCATAATADFPEFSNFSGVHNQQESACKEYQGSAGL